MACCFPSSGSDPEERENNKQIAKQIKKDLKLQEANIKLLLLGPASSGKSTVFKQAISLYGSGFDVVDRKSYTPLIHSSIISGFRLLFTHASKFGSGVSPAATPAKLTIESLSEDALLGPSHAAAIKTLWSDPSIQACWEQEAPSALHIAESFVYFVNKIDAIVDPEYVPTQPDILRVRAPTTGIIETTLKMKDGATFTIVDVGGQRSERRKWIHCFQCVSAVIFVAAISEYNQQLQEDHTQNRLVESFELFDEIVNSKWFADTTLVLFLNKSDLLQAKIKKVPFSSYFHRYKGDNDFESVVPWIRRKFEGKNQDKNKKIYVHVTCAINPDNFKFVFDSVRETVRNQLLKTYNLI